MIPEFYHLNTALSPFDRTHNLQITNLTELPFGPGRRWLNGGGVLAAIVGGWQVNNILSFTSGTPFDVTASGTSLNAPESAQRADQVKSDVEILGGIGRGNAWFDPLAFKPVTEARFGTAPVGRGARAGLRELGSRRLPAVQPAAEHERAVPVRSVQRAQHGALQQPGRATCRTCSSTPTAPSAT